jgi:hypothetical protein
MDGWPQFPLARTTPGNYLVFDGWSRTTWDWRRLEYTASLVSSAVMSKFGTKLKEHQFHIPPERLDKLAVAEHIINLEHRHPLHQTQIHESHHQGDNWDWVHLNLMNKEDAMCLSRSWKPLICSLESRRNPPSHESRCGFSAEPCRRLHLVNWKIQCPLRESNPQPSGL